MIRPIFDILGHVVHARMEMESLKAAIIDEMTSGYRPTHRGHEWDRDMFDVIEMASTALEVTFHLLKGLQFPETREDRLADARAHLSEINFSREK